MQLRLLLLALFWPVAASKTQSITKMHLCMISAPRESANYVLETSSAILAQIEKNGLASRVELSINTATPDVIDGVLPAFPLKNRILAIGPDCLTKEDTDPLPPCGVRQQGLDVANALTACHNRQPGADWIVLLEDDFMPCDNHTLTVLIDTLDSLDPHKTKFARFTQGGGVVAFPAGKVLAYARSVMDHIMTKPCDRVLLEEWSTETDFVFGQHLFKHIGSVSTIGYRNQAEFVRQYSELRGNECGSEIRV